MLGPFDDDADLQFDDPEEDDVCHHGVPFDEDCVDCVVEALDEDQDDGDDDATGFV